MCLAVYNYVLGIFYNKHKEIILKYASEDMSKRFGPHNCINKICAMVVDRHTKPTVMLGMGFIAYFVVAMKYVLVTFPVN